jgi:hypothetical protein
MNNQNKLCILCLIGLMLAGFALEPAAPQVFTI